MNESSFGSQLANLSRRSIVKTLRQPLVVGPTIVFPLFFLAITAPGLEGATKIKGFPTDSYLSFALGMTFVQAGLSAVTTAGAALAEDIRTGFLSRLSLTPMTGGALVLSSLSGTVVLAALAGLLYVLVGVVLGADIEAGPLGAAALVGLSVLFALAFGTLGIFVALRSGDSGTVEAVYPLLFGLFFMSSMAMPRNLIKTEWFEKVATYNPLSYLIEAVRSLLITGWDEEALALGCGISLVMIIVFFVGSYAQLSNRLVRT